MPAVRKKRKVTSQELILSYALVNEWNLRLSVVADPKQPSRSTSMVAYCTFDEPIGNADLLEVWINSVDPEQLGNALQVGTVNAVKPVVWATLYLTHQEFQVLAAFAGGNQKTYVRLVFEPPYRGRAKITSASFSGRYE